MRWIGPVLIILAILVSKNLAAQGYTESDGLDRKHRDFGGKPCLETSGVTHPLASNPRISTHAVVLNNRCSDRISAKVCYYNTDDCTLVEVPGKSTKEQAIGVFPAMQVFRYVVREQF
jgi:hypothetical protein